MHRPAMAAIQVCSLLFISLSHVSTDTLTLNFLFRKTFISALSFILFLFDFSGKFKVKIILPDGNKTDECRVCPIGYFSDKQNRQLCEDCPTGYFATQHISTDNTVQFDRCDGCPRGKFGVIPVHTCRITCRTIK